jgi:hypothetical protein
MPADPTIRAALDAATDALTHALHWQCSDREAASRTAQAFLRKILPDPEFRSEGGFFIAAPFGLQVTTLHALAAAVDAAAMEDAT